MPIGKVPTVNAIIQNLKLNIKINIIKNNKTQTN